MVQDTNERKRQTIAVLISVGFHSIVILTFVFLVAWRPPDPPPPEVGIQLNFGLDEAGFGDVQPDEPVGNEGKDETEPTETNEDQAEVQNSQTTPETIAPQEVLSKTESEVKVEEKKTEPIKNPKPEVKPEPVKEKANEDAVYKPKSTESTKGTDSNKGKPGNQGDQKGKIGDQGDPEGSPDAKGLYGKNGGGGNGASLEMSGWIWDEKPNPPNPGNEQGRLVFEIKVDAQGEIISINKLEGTVSPNIEKLYRKEIEGLTFTPTGNNLPDVSVGKITFVIRAQ